MYVGFSVLKVVLKKRVKIFTNVRYFDETMKTDGFDEIVNLTGLAESKAEYDAGNRRIDVDDLYEETKG